MARKDIKEEIILRDKEILRAAMAERGMTQVKLAQRLGVLQNTISSSINRERMSLDGFKRILNAMGYAVAVIDKRSGDVCWVVDEDLQK